ncbi:hypothetical protein GCM10007919_12560 [Rhizobium indigoferae]|nr:hypothetical protein GCM10007919_12560 [Rhizobium indigoferae]
MGGDPQVAGDDFLQLGNIGFGFLDDGEYPVGMQDEPLAGRVSITPRPRRSTSGIPTSSSSWAIC